MSVQIKLLEWQPNAQNIENSLWVNVEPINRYYTIEPESHVFRVQTQLSLSEYGSDDLGLFPTLEAAKAAAQADFETRIRSALTPAPLSNPEAPAAPVGEPTDAQIKDATTEYLSHRGERPYRVLRGGQELWETHAPAMREAFRAAALVATPPAPTSAVDGAIDARERMLLGWMLAAFEQSKVGQTITDDLKREMRDANRLVARLSCTQAVPATMGGAGEMVLVPREPTREMWAAMADTLYGYKNRHHDKVAGDLWNAALLAAALAGNPSLPSGESS